MLTSLELRAIAYGLVAALLIGLGFKAGDKHIQEKWDLANAAQQEKVVKAQADLIEAQQTRDKLQTTVEAQNETLKSTNAQRADDLSTSLRGYEAALRLGAMSGAVGHSTNSSGTGSSSCGPGQSKEDIAKLNAAVDSAISACLHDSRELTGIQALAPKASSN